MNGPHYLIILDIVQRIGLQERSTCKCDMLGVAFLVYHGIKRQHLSLVVEAKMLGDYTKVHLCAFSLAVHH